MSFTCSSVGERVHNTCTLVQYFIYVIVQYVYLCTKIRNIDRPLFQEVLIWLSWENCGGGGGGGGGIGS